MNLQKSEPENSYDQSQYRINQVLSFMVLCGIMTPKTVYFCNLQLYVVSHGSLLPHYILREKKYLSRKKVYILVAHFS